MKRYFNLILIFSFLIISDKLFCQITIGFDRHTWTIHHIKYYEDAIKKNKLKTLENSTTVYDSSENIINKMRYITYFDSTGKKMQTVYFDKKESITQIEKYVYSLNNSVQKNESKKTKIIYCINSESIDSIELKGLKKFKINSIKLTTDSSEKIYTLLKSKLYLESDISYDSFGNDFKVRYFDKNRNIESTIIYEYNYSSKNFKSYSFINNEKYLVSVGNLNSNNIIVKENYFWIKYNFFNLKNVDKIEPEQTFVYSIDDKNLINKRTHSFIVDDFNIYDNSDEIKITPKFYYQKAISQIKYEYYK